MKTLGIILIGFILFGSTACSYMDTGTDKAFVDAQSVLAVQKVELATKYMEARQAQDLRAYEALRDNPAAMIAYGYSMQSRDEAFLAKIDMPDLVRPKSWADVADRHLTALVNGATLGLVTYSAFDAMKEIASTGATTMSAETIEVSDSFNRKEYHATGSENSISNTESGLSETDPYIYNY